jgi:ATP-dependent Clp endopeptidase proteolytic subunit ClpP
MNSDFKARGSRGEIWLYDPVGASFWGDAISAKMFQKELTALGKVDAITLHVNSPGGDVFDGFAIYNQLKQHPAKITVSIDGLAASIASIISMSGDKINIAANAMMMIHDPQGGAMGNSDEMRRVAALLDTVKGNLAQTYVDRTALDRKQIEDWMAEETWLTADAAVQHGFADAVTDASQVTALFDPNAFRKVPEALRKRLANVSPRPVADRFGVRQQDMDRRLAALLQP